MSLSLHDAAIVAHNTVTLQSLIDRLSLASDKFQLKIRISKTLTMSLGLLANQTPILLNGSPLDQVEKVCHLGPNLSGNRGDRKWNKQENREAITAYSKLTERVWSNKNWLLRPYFINSCPEHASIWVRNMDYKHERKLNSFHLISLCKFLNIKWQDKLSKFEVLQQTSISSTQGLLDKRKRDG